MKSRNRLDQRIFSLAVVIGILLGFSIGIQAIDLSLPALWICLSMALISVPAAVIAYLLLDRVVLPQLRPSSNKQRWLWLGFSLLAGFCLVLEIPLNLYPKPQTVRIIATGQKNALAQGSEVWLTQIYQGRSVIDLFWKNCSGSWVKTPTHYVSYPDKQPSVLTCKLKTSDDFGLRFTMHPWSGKVRAVYDDQSVDEDLFSETGGNKVVSFSIYRTRTDKLIRLATLISSAISIAFLLQALLIWLVLGTREYSEKNSIKSNPWYAYSILMAVCWLIYLLVYWPGFFSPDTVSQFNQIASGQYYDWHPVFHTLFLWLTTRLGFSTIPALVVQILILAAILGWGIHMFASEGMPRWLSWLIALWLGFSPAIGLIMMNTWKDVAYGISLVGLSLMVFYLVWFKARKDITPIFWILFTVALLFVALFRHNGLLASFGTPIVMIVADRRRWRSYLLVLIGTIVLWAGIRGPFYSVINVNKSLAEEGENPGVYSSFVYFLVQQERSGTFLTPAERAILSEIMTDDNQIDLERLAEHTGELIVMVPSVGLRNPILTMDFFLNKSAYIFQILQPPLTRLGYVEMTIYPNEFGFKQDSKIPLLVPYLNRLAAISELPLFDWLFWRNAFWMYFMILGTIVACIRTRKWEFIAVLTPVLLNALPLAVLVGGQISRYIFATLLLGPLVGLGMLFIHPELKTSA